MLTTRRVEYQKTNGTWSFWRFLHAKKITPSKLREHLHDIGLKNVSERYFMGTALHESGFVINVRATEPNGFQSYGLFQIGLPEAAGLGFVNQDLLDPRISCQVMIELAEKNRTAIRIAANLGDNDPDPSDINPYIFIAHNQGRAAAVKTIRSHGLNWASYAARNRSITKPGFRGPAIVRYGNDVL